MSESSRGEPFPKSLLVALLASFLTMLVFTLWLGWLPVWVTIVLIPVYDFAIRGPWPSTPTK